MDTYYNDKLRRIYNGNSVDDVLRYMSSLSQVDPCCNIEPKNNTIRRQKVKSPVSFNPVTMTGMRVDLPEARHSASQKEKKTVPSTLNYKPTAPQVRPLNSSETLMPRHSDAQTSPEARWAYNRVSTVASSSEPYPVYRGQGFKPAASTTKPVFKFTTAPNNKPQEGEIKNNKPSPKFEAFFRKPDPHPVPEPSLPSKQPAFPPPTYTESKNNALAPPTKTVKVDSQGPEAAALVDRIMKNVGITDADKLIQMLKKLQVQEEHDALMSKCPETRVYITKHGERVTYLDVEDVLRVVIPGARICNSDIAQLNNELYDILTTDDHCGTRGRSLSDYPVVRNNTQVVVYDFANPDFPSMYNYIKQWSETARDHILIA